MTKITENDIELLALEKLEEKGFQYLYGPDIAPESEHPEWQSFGDVLLIERLRRAFERLNSKFPAEVREDAVKQFLSTNSPELIANNKIFYQMLTSRGRVGNRFINQITYHERF